ncbi:MAG TPA: hypothetical protein VE650_11190 [Acetobacteraceae bacterium]|jgi:hypothetical protein|nr:hypothetical protein [Acetobacteraceae bacterium]
MMEHRFDVGDRVELIADPQNTNVRPGIYTIVRKMPVTSQGCQYRVKNALDSHERVLEDAQLRRA